MTDSKELRWAGRRMQMRGGGPLHADTEEPRAEGLA